MFLANYSDGVTAVDLDAYLAAYHASGKLAGCLCVQPTHSFHIMTIDDADQAVASVEHIGAAGMWINGGYFVFRSEIFDYMRPGEELVEEPFRRLIAERQIYGHRYDGFWKGMDTLKDKQALEELAASGDAPWQVWNLDHVDANA